MVENHVVKCFPVGCHVAKACDLCKTAAALLFCNKDSVFLCLRCDGKLHINTRHGRVWMCEACEQAPASVSCKADAAALCVTCDKDIHSANPISQRHDRIPVVPFYDCADILAKSSSFTTFLEPNSGHSGNSGNGNDDLISSVTNDDEIDWGIHDSIDIDVNFPLNTSPVDIKSIEMLFPESDHLIDFDFPLSFHDSVNDTMVPFQTVPTAKQFRLPKIEESRSLENRYEIDFTRSTINCYNKNSYLAQSINHSVSSSSIDPGIVPNENSMCEISHPFVLHGVCELDGAPNAQQATRLTGSDREARVMRYREKRKNRKFEKTIRYASRKAYAEKRPRIKGRFAKQTESAETGVDRWVFSEELSSLSSKSGCGLEVEYGVVPSYRRGRGL